MLTGENGIITQAQQSKLQTEIGKEKEYITLSVSTVRGNKIAKGDTSEITSGELQTEMNKYTDEATVIGSGTLTVTYKSGRSYEVTQDGNIEQKEELTPEEAKKIVYATGCIGALLVETADGTVYYVDNLEAEVIQKIEISDAEMITTNGIKEAGDNYFIDNEGKVYTWGYNYRGQLGNGTNEDSNEPICISDIEGNALNGKKIKKIETNNYNIMIALDDEGKVYTWGENVSGQLGNGTNKDSNEPICISDISENALNGKNIVEVQDGIALDSEGKVYTWGANYNGELGNGTNIEASDEPICISDIEGNTLNGKSIEKIQSGYTMIAIDNEGKVYTWGDNFYGELGNGTNEDSNKPICISDIEGNALNGKNIVEMQSDESTIIALDDEGKVYTWGYNLGNGTNERSNEPICISDIPENALKGKNIIELQSDNDTIIVLDSEGTVYTWGVNGDGQLGNGTNEDSNKPICISAISENALSGKSIIEIQIEEGTVLALDSEGKAYIWGLNINNKPIYIADKKSELYDKKIKTVNMSISGFMYLSFITEDGELYNEYHSILS